MFTSYNWSNLWDFITFCTKHIAYKYITENMQRKEHWRGEREKKNACNRQYSFPYTFIRVVLMAQGFFFVCCMSDKTSLHKNIYRNYCICRRAHELDNRNGKTKRKQNKPKVEMRKRTTAQQKNGAVFLCYNVCAFTWAIFLMGLWLSIVSHFECWNPHNEHYRNVFGVFVFCYLLSKVILRANVFKWKDSTCR